MEHKGTVTLETDRLLLRRFTPADAQAAYLNWMGDDKVTKFLRWQTHSDISVSQQVINSWIDEYNNPAFYQWAIEIKELGDPAGTISVIELDELTRKAHIGYCIGSRWWSMGYMSEAFSAVIQFLFDEVGVKRIESQHDPNNPGSGRVMQKCGLKYEGTLRRADWSNVGIVDACIYSILAEEYRK